MGRPMAACIARAGFQVMGFDLSADARSAFAKEGGTAAETIDEAIAGAAAIVKRDELMAYWPAGLPLPPGMKFPF